MSFYICSYCGKETNEKDGICVVCKSGVNDIARNLGLEVRSIPVKKDMGRPEMRDITKRVGEKMELEGRHRRCKHCKKDYLPVSNAQKYCNDCSKKVKKERERKLYEQKTSQVSPGLQKETNNSGNDNLSPVKLLEDHEARIKKLEKELGEYIKVEKIIIAAGLLSEEKFEQAHELVRSL